MGWFNRDDETKKQDSAKEFSSFTMSHMSKRCEDDPKDDKFMICTINESKRVNGETETKERTERVPKSAQSMSGLSSGLGPFYDGLELMRPFARFFDASDQEFFAPYMRPKVPESETNSNHGISSSTENFAPKEESAKQNASTPYPYPDYDYTQRKNDVYDL